MTSTIYTPRIKAQVYSLIGLHLGAIISAHKSLFSVCVGADLNNLSALQRIEQSSISSTAQPQVKSALLNALSINNKSLILSDFIVENELDLVCFILTWHSQVNLPPYELTPTGYGWGTPQDPLVGGGGIIFLSYYKNKSCGYPQVSVL